MTIWQYNRAVTARDAIGNGICLLSSGLKQLGHSVKVVVSDLSGDGDIEWSILLEEVESHISELDTLIAHYSFWNPDMERVLALPCRRIMVYHNITPGRFFHDAGMPGLGEACDIARNATSVLAPRFDHVVCDSEFNKADLPESALAISSVIPVPTRHEALAQRPADLAEMAQIRQNYELVLLYVGRLVPNKYPDQILQVAATCRDAMGINTCTLMVGKSWDAAYTEKLRTSAIELGIAEHVIWLSDASEEKLSACFHAADAYLSLSEHEGFGVPALESMACGLPVIAFDAGAAPEILGSGGVLMQHKFFPMWAGVLQELRSNPMFRQEIVANQFASIRRFALSKTFRAWDALLREGVT
jgi:glycosyltransferase involved in cell wall biosynthesis